MCACMCTNNIPVILEPTDEPMEEEQEEEIPETKTKPKKKPDVSTPEEEEDSREHVNIIFIGHVG